MNFCIDCKKQIASKYAKRCHPCYSLSRVGIPKSDEVKMAVSIAQKGRKHKPQQGWQKGHGLLGNNPTSKGKNWKVKLTEKYRLSKIGDKNPCWKGGITTEYHKIRTTIESRIWREAVLSRDNWTCQKYGTQEGKLHAHHIKSFSDYPELRFAIDNGITLSEKAHKEFHKKYGYKHATTEQLEDFLSKKLK